MHPQLSLSSQSSHSVHNRYFFSTSTETHVSVLCDWGSERLSKGICQNFWNILKSADRAIFARRQMILSRIDEQRLMNCSDFDPNTCLQQISKDSVMLQSSLPKNIFPSVLSAYVFNIFCLVLWKCLCANAELLL